jgi:hypothetical protein
MRNPIPHLVALIGAVAMVACTEPKDAYAQIQSPPAQLLGELKSYASPTQVRSQLPSQLRVETIEDSKLSDSDSRPRFDVLTWRVRDFEHLGHRGELRLTFLNDRLLGAWFYPQSYDSYLGALRDSNLEPASEPTRLDSFTEFWTARDFQQQAYVAWEDARLADEQKRWIMKYS